MSNWVKRYKIYGYNGLDLKKGRHSKEKPLKKSIISSELTSPEKEELICLRAKIEYQNGAVNYLVSLIDLNKFDISRTDKSN